MKKGNSELYNNLSKQITKLKRNFNIKVTSGADTRVLSERVQDRIKAFLLLSHAECEEYFEKRALEIIDNSICEWNSKKIADYHLASMLAYYEYTKKKEKTETKCVDFLRQYKESIKNNHGIKESNITSIYQPIGVNVEDINNVLETDLKAYLESFGGLRGAIAHTSGRTQQPYNINDEKRRIEELLKGIKEFDKLLNIYVDKFVNGIKIPVDFLKNQSLDYEIAKDKLEEKGFTKVEIVSLPRGTETENLFKVKEIKVDGKVIDENFSQSEKFAKNTKIEIYY